MGHVDVDGPGLADAFDVEAFAVEADFAPIVPISGYEDLVSVDDVVFQGIAFDEGLDAQRRVD